MSTDRFELMDSTGSPRVDDIIRGVVDVYEGAFPGRVLGYYLTGSYADGSATSLSDIDLFVVFKADFLDGEEVRARQVGRGCSQLSSIRLDLNSRSEQALPHAHGLLRQAIKTGSRLMYGQDIRDALPAPSVDIYTRDVTRSAFRFSTRVLRDLEKVTLPLAHPDPAEEFLGYDRKRIADWYPDSVGRGTKELVAAVTRIATALLALQAGVLAGSAGESVKQYRAHLDDEWTGLIESLYENARRRWQYRVPDAQQEWALLRLLCERTLAFENHFMRHYHAYLQTLRHSEDAETAAYAAEQLSHFA